MRGDERLILKYFCCKRMEIIWALYLPEFLIVPNLWDASRVVLSFVIARTFRYRDALVIVEDLSGWTVAALDAEVFAEFVASDIRARTGARIATLLERLPRRTLHGWKTKYAPSVHLLRLSSARWITALLYVLSPVDYKLLVGTLQCVIVHYRAQIFVPVLFRGGADVDQAVLVENLTVHQSCTFWNTSTIFPL
jgi:hypothetical protein